MAATRETTVGVFHSHAAAQRAVRRLREAGFSDEQIGVVAQDPENRYGESGTATEGAHAGTGAAAGAATGAGIGALWGLGIIAGAFPAIGPVIAGGALASVLASAATAAVAGGLVGALVGLGVPEEEARYYDSEFQQGRTLVTVKDSARYDEARQIMRDEAAYDYQSRDQVQPAASTGTRAGASVPGTTGTIPGNTGGHGVVYDDTTTRR